MKSTHHIVIAVAATLARNGALVRAHERRLVVQQRVLLHHKLVDFCQGRGYVRKKTTFPKPNTRTGKADGPVVVEIKLAPEGV